MDFSLIHFVDMMTTVQLYGDFTANVSLMLSLLLIGALYTTDCFFTGLVFLMQGKENFVQFIDICNSMDRFVSMARYFYTACFKLVS